MTIEKRHYAVTGVEIRATGDTDTGPLIMRGYASVFDSASHNLGGFREFVAPGAFKRSLAEVQSGDANRNIFALWSHRDDQPLGSVQGGKLKLSEDERGLAFELDTSRMTPAQLDAAKDGELRMSFGFSVRTQEWRTSDDGLDERTLLDVDLFEVSPVISPAYPDTSAAIRSMTAWRSAPADTEVIAPVDEPEEEIVYEEEWNINPTKLKLLKAFADFKAGPAAG